METTRSRRAVLATTASAIAAGLAGCIGNMARGGPNDRGDGGSGPGGGPDTGGPRQRRGGMGQGPQPHVQVSMGTDRRGTERFAPPVVHVEIGGTVEWVLGGGGHDAVAYHPDNADRLPTVSPRRMPEDADPWATDVLTEAGETAEQTFDVEGVYDYACTPHEAMGMTGRVIVGAPDPAEQPALDVPPEGMPDAARESFEMYDHVTRNALGDARRHRPVGRTD